MKSFKHHRSDVGSLGDGLLDAFGRGDDRPSVSARAAAAMVAYLIQLCVRWLGG